MVCTRNCEFTMLASQVGDNKTFRVKTLKGRHNCGRVFANKNANIKWVTELVVYKFWNASILTLSEIIDDVRKQYNAGIIGWRAFKARQMACKLIEGDSSKQYTQLWSYSVELRRVSVGNTCKIQLERIAPDLPPRFGSYELCFNHTIAPINGEKLWPKIENEVILPLVFKAGLGRPKKLRRREPDEDPNPTRLKKTHCVNKCSRCHQQGHNSRKCKLPPPPEVNDGDNQVNTSEGAGEGSQSQRQNTQNVQVLRTRERPKTRMGAEANEGNGSQGQEGCVQNQTSPKQRGRASKSTTSSKKKKSDSIPGPSQGNTIAGPSHVQLQKQNQPLVVPSHVQK